MAHDARKERNAPSSILSTTMRHWYVVYKRKPLKGTICEILDAAAIPYFIPTLTTEKLNEGNTEMVEVKEEAIKNLIFIQTDQDIMRLIDSTDGLRCPMIDSMTHRPAIVPDAEMERFMAIVTQRSSDVLILRDSYSKFCANQRVRVKAGPFEGMEGYIVRILRDRKLVISLGDMAVAISGIDRSLFEAID